MGFRYTLLVVSLVDHRMFVERSDNFTCAGSLVLCFAFASIKTSERLLQELNPEPRSLRYEFRSSFPRKPEPNTPGFRV